MFRSIRNAGIGVAAIAALGLGGAAIAGAATTSTSSSTSQHPSGARPPAAFNGPAPGTTAHEDAEKTVTGTAATQAQAAAVKSVGSGTAGAVTTNYTDNGYETTVTKSDGTKVDVHLDSSFQVMAGPGGAAGPGGPPPSGN